MWVKGSGHIEVKEIDGRGANGGRDQNDLTATRGVESSTRKETNLTRVQVAGMGAEEAVNDECEGSGVSTGGVIGTA